MASKVIGIDLGTTNSVVAVMEGGDPVVIHWRSFCGRACVIVLAPHGRRQTRETGRRRTGISVLLGAGCPASCRRQSRFAILTSRGG